MPAPRTSPRPLLVLITSKPGSGKSTLARRLAGEDALGLPLLSRDALKVGLVETYTVETYEVRATIVPLSYRVFYDTIALGLRGGVSLIAECGADGGRGRAGMGAGCGTAQLHWGTHRATAGGAWRAGQRAGGGR